MMTDEPEAGQDIRHLLRQLNADVAAIEAAVAAVEAACESLLQTPIKHSIESAEDAAKAHRRAHRPGRSSRIDGDNELRAFVLARVDHMTFDVLENEIAKAFPPDRRARRSALHSWWSRNLSPR